MDDHRIRGGWINVGLGTERRDLVRAVFEGVALNSRWMLTYAEKLARTRFDAGITFIGGGAQSDLWCQIMADVLDRPIRQAADPRLANVRGAAFGAAVALGHLRWDDVPDRGEFVLRLALVNRLRGDLAAEKKWTQEAFRIAPFLRETYREMIAGEGARAGESTAVTAFLRRGLR